MCLELCLQNVFFHVFFSSSLQWWPHFLKYIFAEAVYAPACDWLDFLIHEGVLKLIRDERRLLKNLGKQKANNEIFIKFIEDQDNLGQVMTPDNVQISFDNVVNIMKQNLT